MNIEEARKIWRGSDMSETELIEWVRLVNERDKCMHLDKGGPLDKGETIVIPSNAICRSSNSSHPSN